MEVVSETRADGRALLAHRRRPRASLRPPRDPVSRAHAARRLDRRDARRAPAPDRPARRRDGRGARPRRDPREPHGAADVAARAGDQATSTTRSWEVHEVDLEEIVLAYLGYGARPAPREREEAVARDLGELARAAHGDDRRRPIVAVVAALLCRPASRWRAYDHDGVAACLGPHTSPACDEVVHSFRSQFDAIRNLLGWLTLLPGIVGVLLAAPFIAQFESGVHRLDWTQSVTRRRWIAASSASVGAAVLIASGSLRSSRGGGHRSCT